MRRYIKKINLTFRNDYFWLVVFLIIFSLMNVYWIRESESLLSPDIILHNQQARTIYNALKGQTKINFFNHLYPPLVYLTTVFFFFIFGVSPKIAAFSLLIYVIIYVLSIWKTGKMLWNRYVAWVITLLSVNSPIFISYSRVYFLDVPTTAFVALSLYLLVKSDYFKIKRYGYLWGLSIGLGMLTKQTFLFFIVPPIMYMVFVVLKEKWKNIWVSSFIFLIIFFLALPILYGLYWCFININFTAVLVFMVSLYLAIFLFFIIINRAERKAKGNDILLNFLGSLAIGISIAFPYYALAVKLLSAKYFFEFSTFPTPKIIMFYLFSMQTLFLWGIIFIAIGILFTLINPIDRQRNKLILVSFLGSLILATFYWNPKERYILPILPYAVILGGFWIYKIKRLKIPVMSLVIIITIFQLFGWMLKYKFPAYFLFRCQEIQDQYLIERIEKAKTKFSFRPIVKIPEFCLMPIFPALPKKGNYSMESVLSEIYDLSENKKIAIIVWQKKSRLMYSALLGYYSYIKNHPFASFSITSLSVDPLQDIYDIIMTKKDDFNFFIITDELIEYANFNKFPFQEFSRKLRLVTSREFLTEEHMFIYKFLKKDER